MRPDSPRRLRACLMIFVLALAVRLTLLFGFHRYEFSRPEAVKIAISLAQHGAFADPYYIPTGPTAHTAPIYPALIAPFYALLGDSDRADLARFAFNAVIASVGYALLPLLAEALGIGWWTGMLAGLAGSLIPLHHWPECLGLFENTCTGVFLELATLHLLRFLRAGSLAAAGAARAGLLWGLGILLSPTVVVVLAAFPVIAWRKLRPSPRAAVGFAVVFTAALLAVLSPWVFRNWKQELGLCVVRDDLGLELFVSNHDGATAVAEQNFADPYWREVHPHVSLAAATELKSIGERAFERRKLSQAIDWIRTHPRQFAGLTLQRIVRFWFPAMPRFEWAFWAVTVLAAAGWIRMFQRVRFAAIVLAAVLLPYSAVFSVIETSVRYQHPIWWCLVLLACFAGGAGIRPRRIEQP